MALPCRSIQCHQFAGHSWAAQAVHLRMRDNANLEIFGERCKLVPYRSAHVQTYHAWMVGVCRVLPQRQAGRCTALPPPPIRIIPVATAFMVQKCPALQEATASEPLSLEVSFRSHDVPSITLARRVTGCCLPASSAEPT